MSRDRTDHLRCVAKRRFRADGFVLPVSLPVIDVDGFITSRSTVYALAIDQGTREIRQDATRASVERKLLISWFQTDDQGVDVAPETALTLEPTSSQVILDGLYFPVLQPRPVRPVNRTILYKSIVSTESVTG